MIQSMKLPLLRLCKTPWLVTLAAISAVSCAPTNYPEPLIRKPVPTLPDAEVQRQKPEQKNTILVRRGDSLYVLARRHGIAIRGLIDANGLKAPYIIHPGQRLKLPRSRYHIVGGGETVYSIARAYNVEMGPLVRINRIPPPYRVKKGQRLRLPDPIKPKTRQVVSVDRASGGISTKPRSLSKPPQWVVRPRPTRERPPAPPKRVKWQDPDSKPLRAPPPRSGRKFLWPLKGKVIVAFGVRKGGLHNDGINIAARKGEAIRAAENGVVAYAGNQLPGFGNLVLIKHSGGWMSAYAHSSVVHVNRGDVVRRGQVIARVGRTGNVSRPQLHFELRKGDRAVNPRRYLVRFAYLMGRPTRWARHFE